VHTAMKNILIVEDEILIGMMLAESVRELGCRVSEVVTTGEEALLAVGKERPDAILMDINLDGKLDGIETARRITSEAAIPVVFFTGYQDPVLLQKAKALNPVAILDKLGSTTALHTTLHDLFA
jgi:two-component system, response regulator PdtaR